MAFIRYYFIATLLLAGIFKMQGQIVYYPSGASTLLQTTAADMAMLMEKAVTGSTVTVQPYDVIPEKGIILVYDSTISDNQACKVKSNGVNLIRFSAMEDNGLHFGIYQYLHQLGFRFYQPGSIWQITPSLLSAFKSIDTTYNCSFTYKSWFISGGHNRWAMDNENDYSWDTYDGVNGHEWALYQRRNGMTGKNKFIGHRGDLMTGTYMAALRNNPCFTACFNGKRDVNEQSVPDVNNVAAMQLWSNAIEQNYTHYKNTIFGNRGIYPNLYRNFNYQFQNIGLEVPDGARYANSKDNTGCSTNDLTTESDQHFTLANFSAEKLNILYPEKRCQVYAYDGHSDIPSIKINPNIDVQVVAQGFQSETSVNGLLNRWYNKTNHVSEYQYFNLSQWSGETPSFYLQDLINTIERLKIRNSDGVICEASPAKFASLPFLLASNRSLLGNVSIDSTLREFCNSLFAGAANSIYDLLKLWGDDKIISVGDWMNDSKYKIPLYLQLVKTADLQTQNAPAVVKQRIQELKAYLHYMVLYYDWAFDQRTPAAKPEKAAALCTYLARVNRLQIVNSYFMILVTTSNYSNNDSIYKNYNVDNGKMYQKGKLPLITAGEIENDFSKDYDSLVIREEQYQFENAGTIVAGFAENKMEPLEKISIKIGYTNGKDYCNRSEFYINATAAGNFTIRYMPQFDMPGKGYINFTVETTSGRIQIIKDFSLDNRNGAGTLNIALPEAGTYKLSVVSKYKSSVDIQVTTNGNYFYRNGGFLGTTVENYRANLLSLPGYFHVPAGITRIYFSVNNANPGGKGFATPAEISNAFLFKNAAGEAVTPRLVSAGDSAFFYMDVPSGMDNSFWQAFKMEQYRLCFTNISNMQWYAQRKNCGNTNFTTSVVSVYGECITRIKKTSASTSTKWILNDGGTIYQYENRDSVDLPHIFSPSTIVTLTIDGNCTVTKCLNDNAQYLKQKETCTNAAPAPVAIDKTAIFPNPGNGIFYCMQNNSSVIAAEIVVFNTQGVITGKFKNTASFNIAHLPSGVYLYQATINEKQTRGKLVKW